MSTAPGRLFPIPPATIPGYAPFPAPARSAAQLHIAARAAFLEAVQRACDRTLPINTIVGERQETLIGLIADRVSDEFGQALLGALALAANHRDEECGKALRALAQGMATDYADAHSEAWA